MQKNTFFCKKMHFFCPKYLVFKDFLVILQQHSKEGNKKLTLLIT